MKAAFLLMILGCTTPAPRGPHAALKELEETQVANCRKIGRYSSSSALAGESGMAQAREEARAKAAAAGANTVVAAREWQTPDNASASVDGFDCP